MAIRLVHGWRLIWLTAALILFLALTAYQLGLPGLHYDEAKEAGVNAMELLTGAPVTAFRGATLDILGWQLPLMVQDYIGALNVYLALPFLALTGIGVPNLRGLSIGTGLLALILLERALSEYCFLVRKSSNFGPQPPDNPPISLASLITVTLLAASPSFVFWSRQGIFVTNLTQPLCFWCIWQGVRWLRTGRRGSLVASALAGGLALYAKLLAGWVVGAFVLVAGGWWVWQRRRAASSAPSLSWRLFLSAWLALMLPLLPLIVFNIQTGGTAESVWGNLGQSYYGVVNRDVATNLVVRLTQLAGILRGDHLWYLGGIHSNWLAPWLALGVIIAGVWRSWRLLLPPLLLLSLAVSMSLFTISDLFITHYALIQPLVVAVVGLGFVDLVPHLSQGRILGSKGLRVGVIVPLCVSLWLALDSAASLRYHLDLQRSGGVAAHSDASYHLAYYLRHHGLGAPIALDWGIDATVRFLSQGTVTPIEIFGYGSPAEPDADFAARLRMFLANPDNVYLLHAPEQTVFVGRREVMMTQARTMGRRPHLEQQFAQGNQQPLYELWRIRP